MRLAIIGAGSAGLCSAKQSKEYGFKVTIFEQTKHVGGLWVYSEQQSDEKDGVRVHPGVYYGLKTLSAKESMGYPDFDIPKQDLSFIPSEDVREFYNLYADKYNLREHIKFQHYVLSVRPSGDHQWEIVVKDLVKNTVKSLIYDAVMVCNGHYSKPFMPHYKGKDLFQGRQMHTFEFRRPDTLKNENVLIIGSGPSGLDLATKIAQYANRVTISHITNSIPDLHNIEVKPDVAWFTGKGAVFVDGSYESFTAILYCTGYLYSFPFLSVDCGIVLEADRYVKPLYKQIINIKKPTMAFIGLPFNACHGHLHDIQARFFLKFLSGEKTLPSTEEMKYDLQSTIEKRFENNIGIGRAHDLGYSQNDYYVDLANTAEIEPIKPVVSKIWAETDSELFRNFSTYRNNIFKIIDDESFIKEQII